MKTTEELLREERTLSDILADALGRILSRIGKEPDMARGSRYNGQFTTQPVLDINQEGTGYFRTIDEDINYALKALYQHEDQVQ